MANTDKNLVITPNIGSSSDDPKITFSGADSSLGAQSLNARIYPTSNGTLSFEGSAGQLFSITNSLTGTIFSVNDVSGLPSIEVLDTGVVRLARYGGRVLVGNISDNGVDPLQFSTGANATFGNVTTTNMFGTATSDMYIRTPSTSTIGNNAKWLWIVGGDNTAGSGNAEGGRVIIYGGVGKGTSRGGSITLNSGASGTSSSTGSDVNIYGGDASAATTTGGRVFIQAGQTLSTATTSATGGPLYLFGGKFLSTTGTRVGGSVFIDAGSNGYNSTIGSESGNVNIGTSGSGFAGATTRAINIGSGTTITSISGNVSIGTSSTTEKLTISQGNIYTLRTGGAKLRLADQLNEVSLESVPVGSSSEAILKTSSLERMRVDQNGNVAIGTSNTALGRFTVSSSVAATASPNYFPAITLLNGSDGGARILARNSIGAYTAIDMTVESSGGGTDDGVISFWTSNNGVLSESARINYLGRFGIGTNQPLTKLDVRDSYIIAGSNTSTSGSKILGGYYSSGVLSTIGSEQSSGGISMGYAVWPANTGTASFVSSTTITIPRGAYTIPGDSHLWYIGSNQTVAIDSPVTMSEIMRLNDSGLLVGSNTAELGAGFRNFQVQGSSGAIVQSQTGAGTVKCAISTDSSAGYAGTRTNHQLIFTVNNTARARIDTAGNLGVAVTPSTWSNDGNIQLKADRFISGGLGSIRIASNVYYDTDFRYISTGVATYYQQNAGVHSWHYKASGTGGTTFAPVEYARISTTGGFSVGTTSDPGAGAIYATGNITAYFSDERLKTKLGNIENALDKVSSISGFYHEANELAESLGYKKVREVGVSAQEVQKVMPEVVAPAPISDEYLTVRYERLVPLLIEAIKELKSELETLKKSINQNG